MKKIISVFSIIALSVLSVGMADAQIMLQKAAISNGGGMASNSTMKAQMTTGQPVTGTASNSTMKAEYGFWTSESAAGSGVLQTMNLQLSVNIFPNPVSDIATANITLANSSDLDVRIFDVNGIEVKNVFSGNSSNGTRSFEINLSGLASGSYILAARIPGQLVETRISVVR